MRRQRSAFNLVELSVAMLVLSALGLGVASYLKKQNIVLTTSSQSGALDKQMNIVAQAIRDEIRQAVYLNPACADIYSGATINCSNLEVRGGITPLPGASRQTVDGFNDLAPPSNLESSNFSFESDAIRIVQFNLSNEFDCALDRDVADNPSSSDEELTVSSDCTDKLSVGQIYILVEEINSVIYSNVFQATAINTTTNVVSIASDGNLYNQLGGLGVSGFSNEARIFPIKIVELAIDSADGGLYKREITPDDSDLDGYQSWVKLFPNVESLQFFPLTSTTGGAIEHARGMAFTVDEDNDGIEDIRGVSPWFVLKSGTASLDANVNVDNPITSSVESDKYARENRKFFVSMYNYSNN